MKALYIESHADVASFMWVKLAKHLKKRVSQHKYNVRSADTRSALYNHTVNCNFPISWSNAEALYRNSNFIERNVLESAYIYHTDDNNFNTSPGLYKLDQLVLHIIQKQYKF